MAIKKIDSLQGDDLKKYIQHLQNTYTTDEDKAEISNYVRDMLSVSLHKADDVIADAKIRMQLGEIIEIG